MSKTKQSATTVNFLSMLNEANAIVQQQFPGAQFYEADYSIQQPDTWRFVFNVPPNASHNINTTAIVLNIGGQFSPVQHIDQPWLEDRVIPLPVLLSLNEAEALAQMAGFTGEIAAITLRWPLYPGVNEPEYIFAIPSQSIRVFVGVYSHKVTSSPLTKTR